VKNLSEECNFDEFQRKCVNNATFRANFVVRPVRTIQDPPPHKGGIGLGVELSGRAQAELMQMMTDYLRTADMMVAENEGDYPHLYEEVRAQCPDAPQEPIGSI